MRIITDIKEFIRAKIELTSVFLPKEQRLTNRELEFFVECIYFQYIGNDLENFKSLVEHIKDVGVMSKKREISQYKTKLSKKGWIQSGHKTFVLPKHLDIRKGEEKDLKIEVTYEREDEQEFLEGSNNGRDYPESSREEQFVEGTGSRTF